MLTFILLVVLGGGVGLLVVSLAESPKPTAEWPRSERGRQQAETEPEVEPEPGPELDLDPDLDLEPASAAAFVGPADEARPPGGPPRRREPVGPVPRSRIAIEGRFADVARVPLWRRFLAVAGILAITVTTGVAVAAVLAAMIGAAAEVLGNTIG